MKREDSLIPSDELNNRPVRLSAERTTEYSGTAEILVLQELLRIVVRRRKWIIGAVAVGVIAAIAITWSTVPVYESTATVELNGSDTGSFNLSVGDMVGAQNSVGDGLHTDLQTQTEILQDDTVALAVIEKLNLQTQPPFLAPQKSGKDAASQVDPERNLPLESAPKKRARLLGVFKKHLTVKPVRDTRLIQVSFQSHNPKQAAEVANALIESYKGQYLKTHYDATAEASDWLTRQLSDLKGNVESSERKLVDFERDTGIIGLDMQGGQQGNGAVGVGLGYSSLVIQKLQELNTELTVAEANRIGKEAIYRLTKTGDADLIVTLVNNVGANAANSAVFTQGGGLSNLDRLRSERNELEQNLTTASSMYGANNRHLKELQLQIATVNDQIRNEVKFIADRAAADFQLAKQTEDGIRKELDTQQGLASKLNEKTIQFALLSQEASSRKQLYEDLYTKLQEANVSAGVKATNITVVDPARSAAVPIKPNSRINIALGLFLGLFFGFALAFLIDGLDQTIGSPEEIQALVGFPEMGIIPELQRSPKNAAPQGDGDPGSQRSDQNEPMQVWMLSQPNSAASEAIRALRTSVMLSKPGRVPKVILVTSCVPGEGKTTVSANLGVAFAQHHMRVVVVEADMRRARIAHAFGVRNEKGLSNVLTGERDLSDAIQRGVCVENLDMLACGPRPPLPSELLGSAAFEQLLLKLRDSYDLVLIDSPPALMVTDAIIISNLVDAVIWVAGAGIVTRPMIRRAADIIRRNRMPLVGFVLNRMKKGAATSQYGYTYYGSYYGDASSDEI
jgi:capsular exopolysaccharide synthesis family protein